MILTNRLFERNVPSRNAKSIFIFCEGRRREYDYFKYFKEKDSRINIEIHKIAPDDNNSPEGLFDIAVNAFCPIEEKGYKPKYDLIVSVRLEPSLSLNIWDLLLRSKIYNHDKGKSGRSYGANQEQA